ncbi:BQ5605_C004g03118 [Microbotryum silenes-dioicae]|uniref:BQ5605_C004g03118 protein n=1 Tax=Microbotryum silenes-dioicae TaxID=796604 RepID=A0A2X0MEC7_9BASI|nr:BQ5605_C004g03118 [Microbotryum silenes-dioicae]
MPSRGPPTASASALARANAKQASIDATSALNRSRSATSNKPRLFNRGYDQEDDPDRLYYSKGLGKLDSDDESGDDDSVGMGESYYSTGDEDEDPHANDHEDYDDEHPHLSRPHPTPFPSYVRPAKSFDLTPANHVDGDSFHGVTGNHDGAYHPSENDGGDDGKEEGGPEVDARFEWQHMLANVLQGDVLKSEKTRLSTASLSTTTHLTNNLVSFSGTGTRTGKRQQAYAIWLLIRAKIRGRSPEEESRYLEEARAKVDEVIDEVLKFRVIDLKPAPSAPPISEEARLQNAADQVAGVLRRVDWCEGLYPSRKALALEKDRVSTSEVVRRTDALRTWQKITKRLKVRCGILKVWTGTEWDKLSDPAWKANPNEPTPAVGDGRGFVANILREDALQETFKKRLLSDVYSLVLTAKEAMTDLSADFQAMNLPGFAADLHRLAIFPSRLAQEALRSILESVAKIDDPSVVLIDQLTNDLRKGLSSACEVKKQYLDLVGSDPAVGWSLPGRVEEYEETMLSTLRYFFKLLHWKLKSPSKAIYFKETEIVEKEWGFLSIVTEQIEGGDLLVGEHFSTLTHRLLVRVMSYFETQLQVLETRDMSPQETLRWFSQTLDNVRARHRKLLRFGKTMLQRFENSAEYLLDDIDLTAFINGLVDSHHFMIYTGTFERDGIYIVGDPSMHERPELVHAILARCFSSNTQGDAQGVLEADYDDQMHYVLLLSPRDPFLWTGRIMNLELPRMEFDLREKRVRLVSDGPSLRLARSKQTFTDIFPRFTRSVIVEQKAHLARVSREIKKIGRAIFRLAETILGSIDRVRAVSQRRPEQGQQELVGNYFTFAADLGNRSIKYLEPAVRSRYVLMLMKFAIAWVAFICDDCVPTDPRTFKWAVAALEFAQSITRGENILKFSAEEFALLRTKVASCMTLLISHFDILGARSSQEAKKEQERIDAARIEMKEQLALRFAQLKKMRGTKSEATDELEVGDQVGRSGDDGDSVGSLQMAWDKRIEALAQLDELRVAVQTSNRVVGRVLDQERAEDSALAFLASSSSNISIRWQQGKFIGGGSFGTVYLAVNLDSGQELAVKEIRFQDLASAPHLVKTVRDEMKVMEMLRHDNIVQYYGIEVHRDKVYIFEEYCPGGSLANLLEHGAIQDEIIIQIYALQMLNGLIYLHAQDVVHRDIKPDNILLDADGTIKFVDFGAAKVLAKGQKTIASRSRMSTGGGAAGADGGLAVPGADQNSLTGTPMYLSPETVKGERRGKKGAMDVWAVGCVILECATGHRPWSNLDNEWYAMFSLHFSPRRCVAIMFHIGIAVQHPPLPDPSQLSELGIDFIRQCLTIDPDDRPSAAEMIHHPWITMALEQLSEMNETETPPVTASSSRSGAASSGSLRSSLGTSSLLSRNTSIAEEEEDDRALSMDSAGSQATDNWVEGVDEAVAEGKAEALDDAEQHFAYQAELGSVAEE